MDRRIVFATLALMPAGVLWNCGSPPPLDYSGPTAQWPSYANTAGGTRYSPLTQIDRGNVEYLEVAWTYHTGDVSDGGEGAPAANKSAFQATPIVVDGTMYVATAFSRVIALDPESGEERWTFDPEIDLSIHYSEIGCRGLSTWLDSERASGEECRRRIILADRAAGLHALDARTGKPCSDFGDNGRVDLSDGIGPHEPGHYGVTSPPVIIGDVIVTGSAIGDNKTVNEISGMVRGYDARSGELRWSWDPIPRKEGAPGREDWTAEGIAKTGSANAWSILSADPERDLVFVPTGSASPDFYGGERPGDNRWSSSVVALRGSTGEFVWGFQTVHHDLWDYDVASQPTLVTIRRDGEEIPAVAQPTKMGLVFLLHRETGEPLFPVEERPVPLSDVPGEYASPTQPFPVKPPPLAPQELDPKDAFGLTFWDRGKCQEILESYRYEGIYTPPSTGGTLLYPSAAGGTNWGSAAFEPSQGLLVLNTSNYPHMLTLIPREDFDAVKAANPGKEVYPQAGTPFGILREAKLSPFRSICTPTPWGQLHAVDLSTGEIRWQVTLGTIRAVSPIPLPIPFGTPTTGGPIVTADGLVFIGAAMDNYLRAFDIETGEELWKGRLPAGGQVTPMTYRLSDDGKQYVVIAAGGHGRMGTTLGDAVVAFALP